MCMNNIHVLLTRVKLRLLCSFFDLNLVPIDGIWKRDEWMVWCCAWEFVLAIRKPETLVLMHKSRLLIPRLRDLSARLAQVQLSYSTSLIFIFRDLFELCIRTYEFSIPTNLLILANWKWKIISIGAALEHSTMLIMKNSFLSGWGGFCISLWGEVDSTRQEKWESSENEMKRFEPRGA